MQSVIIFDLSGNIRIGEDSLLIHNTIREALARGERRLLLNLADISRIDSSGLGELVAAYATCSREGAELKLLNLTQGVRELMVITKLLIVFEVYEDEGEALESFEAAFPESAKSAAVTGKLKNSVLDV